MSIVRKSNRHTRPSQHTQATNGRVNSPVKIKSLARRCGLSAVQMRVGDGWDWYVTRGSLPVFQGDGHDVVVFLRGYRRGVEDEQGRAA